MVAVTFDTHSLILDGVPTVIRSAAIHYFRLPHPSLWHDRLVKLKAAGYNTIDVYFNWAFHSKAPGQYDFEGCRDVAKLLGMINDLGLWLIARPGPYINAELAAGGLPSWVLTMPDVRLRHRNADGGYQFCPQYGQAVTEWYDQIVPFIEKCPNLIAFQIENEFATTEMDPEPITTLATMARQRGIKAPLFHNDLYAMGLYADVLDLYAFDHYPVTDFEEDWRLRADHVFSLIDNVEAQIRPYCTNRPLMVAECQAGWFSGWCTPEEFEMETVFGREFLPLITKTLLAQGVTVFNHYMATGGTNWGSMGALDTHSSYDFAAPISESGELRESLYEAKAINQFLASFNLSRTQRIDTPNVEQAEGLPLWLTTRAGQHGEHWVFYRNLTALPETFSVRPLPKWPEAKVHIAAQEALILPLNVPLKAPGWTLLWSSTECVTQNANVLVLKADHDATVMLQGPVPDVLPSADGVTITPYEDGVILFCPGRCDEEDEPVRIVLGNLTVLLINQPLTDTLWLQPNGSMVMGAVAQLGDNTFTIMDPEDPVRLVSPAGRLAKEVGFTDSLPHHLPLLEPNRVCHGAAQLVDIARIDQPVDTACYQDGLRWYGLTHNGPLPATLTVMARHHVAVFVNGECIHSAFNLDDVMAPPTPMCVTLPTTPTKTTQLALLVDSLGISKGFHDDPRQPQGLLSVLTPDGEEWLPRFKQSHQLTRWQPALKRLFGTLPETAPVVIADMHFSLSDYSAYDMAIALEIDEIPVPRIDIYLNHHRVGRYRHHRNNQTRFQLPVGLLNPTPGADNHLELVFIQPSSFLSFAQVQQMCHDDVHLVFASVFQKITL
jgi:hypothetical protein